MLNLPKLVSFDFGGTLVYDGEFKPKEGLDALRLAANNPEVTTAEAMLALWKAIFVEVRGKTQYRTEFHFDLPLSAVFNNIFTRLGLRFSISMDDCEAIFDSHNSTRSTAPNIKPLLSFLNEAGIRTCVVSNIAMTGRSLRKSLDRLIPDNGFSFVCTSRDYIVCKPSPDLFEAMLMKAGVGPEECWHCGDSISVDVVGALNAGLTAIHYNVAAPIGFEQKRLGGRDYCSINNWSELRSLLSGRIAAV